MTNATVAVSEQRVFFDPTPEALRWLIRDIDGRYPIEVGAGTGYLSQLIRMESNLFPFAIDIDRYEKLLYKVWQVDATEFDYPIGSVVIMARPCDGEWVKKAIDKAMKDVDAIYYIGKNYVAEHLAGIPYHVALVFENAGAEGEDIYKITKHICR